ncbi:hypothetical protein H2201_004820 [Coniosporium apollinis]|uniref:Uncharacterized protein n=1 Tax=Coniosporium apollinis TaxID=61459 RepID=A0ABQ9NRX0_9PEZI|nr:hypothetical protein H2201_004820 [Coniosporium apollinis]
MGSGKNPFTDWCESWQGKMWSSDFFLTFVRDNLKIYDNTKRATAPVYEASTNEQQNEFWKLPSRWTLATVLELFGTLDRGVDITAAWENPDWHSYMRGVYTVACVSTWRNRMKPGVKPDRYQVYEDIRGVPNTYYRNRPQIDHVPTKPSITSRQSRQVHVPTWARSLHHKRRRQEAASPGEDALQQQMDMHSNNRWRCPLTA